MKKASGRGISSDENHLGPGAMATSTAVIEALPPEQADWKPKPW